MVGALKRVERNNTACKAKMGARRLLLLLVVGEGAGGHGARGHRHQRRYVLLVGLTFGEEPKKRRSPTWARGCLPASPNCWLGGSWVQACSAFAAGLILVSARRILGGIPPYG